MMQGLIDCLGVSDAVTIVPSATKDFLDYDALIDNLYRDLAGLVKLNQIFSCDLGSNKF